MIVASLIRVAQRPDGFSDVVKCDSAQSCFRFIFKHFYYRFHRNTEGSIASVECPWAGIDQSIDIPHVIQFYNQLPEFLCDWLQLGPTGFTYHRGGLWL